MGPAATELHMQLLVAAESSEHGLHHSQNTSQLLQQHKEEEEASSDQFLRIHGMLNFCWSPYAHQIFFRPSQRPPPLGLPLCSPYMVGCALCPYDNFLLTLMLGP